MVHERYDVYRKALLAVRAAVALTRCFPHGSAWLRDQLHRAVAKAPLQIAEGLGRKTRPDRERFFDMARASYGEACSALDVAEALAYVSAIETGPLRELLSDCIKMLYRMRS